MIVKDRFSERSRLIPRSALHEVHDMVEQRAGSVLPLHIGEPHIGIPEVVKDAYVKAIQDGHSYYCDSPGLLVLREALSDRFQQTQGVAIPAPRIFTTPGSCQGIASVLLSLACEGASVLLPEIHWPMHLQQIVMAGLKPKFYKESESCDTSTEALDDAYDESVCAIIVTSPSNPTGRVLDFAAMQLIHTWAMRRSLFILSDEAYEDFVFEGELPSMNRLDSHFPEKERIVFSVHTFSKGFSFTGYRVGYVSAPNGERANLFQRVQEAVLVSPATPVQFAALAALQHGEHLRLHREYVKRTRDEAAELLLPAGLLLMIPRGGWYALLDLSRYTGDANAFCQRLMENAGVALAPGRAFCMQENKSSRQLARIALCRERSMTLEGIRRILGSVTK